MKRSSLFLLAIVAFAAFGCARSYRDTTQYLKTGKLKPIVAVLPVIDNTHQKNMNWDLSTELTEELKTHFLDSDRVYLLQDERGTASLAKALNEAAPTAIAKNSVSGLSPAEFVVVAEIIEQNTTPYGIATNHPEKTFISETGAILSMSMRIRVIDVRSDKPEVILQEVVDTEYNITRPYLCTNYSKAHWGTEEFTRTPMGIAHLKLIRDVISHVEGYVVAR